MGRYYDVKRIIEETESLGKASSYISKPTLKKDETLVGIVVWLHDTSIFAIAPELTDDKRYEYWCKNTQHAYPILHIHLYKLNSNQASDILDAPAVELINFDNKTAPVFSELHVQEYKGLAGSIIYGQSREINPLNPFTNKNFNLN